MGPSQMSQAVDPVHLAEVEIRRNRGETAPPPARVSSSPSASGPVNRPTLGPDILACWDE